MTRPSSPKRSSQQPPIRSRSCAIPPARRPDASAPCAASFPRGSTTGRFGSSTACPLKASTLTQPHLRRTVMVTTSNDAVVTSYAKAPARTITVDGATYAYRELGPKGRIPVIFFVHLAGNLDNWDPRIIDPIAKEHHVIAFDNRGVGASTGQVPDSVEAMADDAYTFIHALGLDKVDIFSFSLGGFIANGDNDRMVPSVLSEDLHRRIPGSELIIFPDSGHGGIFQFHDKFAPIAVQFLDR